ncbi:MAG: YidC/Oxa1 family membrane protein insertase [Clostridia bacterium]|nr:YidC/Oxa1 family membrane protein insertase [Clostridia bacterium]
MNIIQFGTVQSGNFLVNLIGALVNATSVVIGVILFTLILKAITLPFDFISRSSMRKNSIKMEEMRPELERLQKQYANNKELYNQKMMALYKKNGYSVLGACLPTLITIVIFIVAISAFNNYSKFQNLQYYSEMSKAYNSVVYEGFEVDGDYIYYNDNNELVFNDEKLLLVDGSVESNKKTIYVNKTDDKMTVSTKNGYMEYSRVIVNGECKGEIVFNIIEENLENNKTLKLNDKTFDDYKKSLENKDKAGENFLKEIGAERSAETFRKNQPKFLWIKNIWVSDSAFNHAVEKDFNKFKSTYSYEHKKDKFVKEGKLSEDQYQVLISKLDKEQKKPNGYFILVLLTAGSSLLSQIVIGKSQKAQMELQTVDGQGAQTQKTMNIMMPILMAIFSFLYTAAFSIYIVLNSILTIGSTFAINAIVDLGVKKEEAKKATEKTYSRTYIPKQEEKKEEEKSKKKKEQIVEHDFLSGLADRHHGPKIK